MFISAVENRLVQVRERFVKNDQARSDCYGERRARTYIGVWVQGQSPWCGKAPGQGVRAEADDILSIKTPQFAFSYIDELVILRH